MYFMDASLHICTFHKTLSTQGSCWILHRHHWTKQCFLKTQHTEQINTSILQNSQKRNDDYHPNLPKTRYYQKNWKIPILFINNQNQTKINWQFKIFHSEKHIVILRLTAKKKKKVQAKNKSNDDTWSVFEFRPLRFEFTTFRNHIILRERIFSFIFFDLLCLFWHTYILIIIIFKFYQIQ